MEPAQILQSISGMEKILPMQILWTNGFLFGGNTKARFLNFFHHGKENAREKVLLKDVASFYSEVMFDIDQLLKAE
jgi:hypothetical protein